ncbi:uncharacterized protein BKA55DRAFT_571880 [Fusarium redolens]|uniref:Uncharacterized protein n=1 Tax=Fusarium redolens TaxID=48865 RepID=A0A9P9GZ34_FUSRE|nr:uncharacterized protein BKA55DRAFT_571880 [Fusarium redolens]KAH7247457.1 hypothetical protein BKA55DRAFT_571880 [Fusarium redolens]
MIDTSVSSERFSLVASFYGPGNITSWLCMVISVFVTWCFNTQYRRKDSINTDLIFVLVVPGVAAGHVIYMIFFSGVVEHQPAQELFTSSDSQIVQHAAAAEAALNVCETFSAVAVLLVFISMCHGHLKRTLAVVVVGLLAFSTEAVVFVQTRGVRVSDSNLTRPFLFNFFEVMVSLLIFLGVWLSAFGIMVLWLRLRTIDTPEEQIYRESADSQLEMDIRSTLRSQVGDINSTLMWGNQLQAVETLQLGETDSLDQRVMMPLTMVSMVFLPLSLLVTLASMSFPTRIFGATSFISSPSWAALVLFFVPKSATSITELDQIVSVCIGSTALLFSVWEAFKSQRKEDERARRENRQRAADGRRTRRQRELTYALYLLRRVNHQLDQTEDETERQVLLDRRNILMINMSRMVSL